MKGLVICSRKWLSQPGASMKKKHIEIGAASRPKPGERINGDCFLIHHLSRTETLTAVVDGLGHGIEANEASRLAVKSIKAKAYLPLPEIIRYTHETLLGTRGATIGAALIQTDSNKISFVGMGNIEARVVTSQKKHALISLRGIVGLKIRTPRIYDYIYEADNFLVLYSDGINSGWQNNYENWDKHPQQIAEDISIILQNITMTQPSLSSNSLQQIVECRIHSDLNSTKGGTLGELVASSLGFAKTDLICIATALSALIHSLHKKKIRGSLKLFWGDDGQRGGVLVIDLETESEIYEDADDKSMPSTLRKLMDKLEVKEKGSGRPDLYFEKKLLFDICILNTQMSPLDGYELAQSIRKLEHPLSEIPLLALSSAFVGRSGKYRESGFNGFLPSPIRIKKLLNIVSHLIVDQRATPKKAKKQDFVTQHSIADEQKHSIHILLAEDNPVNAKLALHMLAKAGYRLTLTKDGQETIDVFCTNPELYDMILMDIQMPNINGYEATKAIREMGFKNIPIIAITAHTMQGDREKCLKAGLDDYIPKPIKRELIYKVVKKWCLDRD